MEQALSIEQVLATEADKIHGGNLREEPESRLREQEAQKKLRDQEAQKKLRDQEAQKKLQDQKAPEGLQNQKSSEKLQDQKEREERAWLNADDRDGTRLPDGERERREELYRALNQLNRAALCFSGGGIRSATFCLGVLQALAGYDVTRHEPHSHEAAPTGPGPQASTSPHSSSESAEAAPPKAKQKPEVKPEIKPENSLLGCFDYLSTVSGGGYVGSWLSSWRTREDFPAVIRSLTSRPDGADVEPAEISWLRAYSNYLTPRLGIASADSWAAVAICVRNLILNWLVIIPVVCFVLLALKTIATLGVRAAHYGSDHLWMGLIPALGVACLIFAQSFTNRYRPSRRTEQDNVNETTFLCLNFLWAFISAILLTIFFASHASEHILEWTDIIPDWIRLHIEPTYFSNVEQLGLKTTFLLLMAGAGFLIYLIGWIAGRRLRGAWPDFMYWAVSGLVYGALVGVGAYLYYWFEPYKHWPAFEQNEWYLLIPIIFGVPWVLTSQLTADSIFVGLASYEPISDSDREWLGRAAGWLAAGAFAWALTAFLVFAGGYFIQTATGWTENIVVPLGSVTGILSGIVTAFLGSSAKTAANATSDKQGDKIGKIYNVVLAVSGPLFSATLIIALSIALDKVLLGGSLIDKLKSAADANSIDGILVWLAVGLAIAAAIGLIASFWVNINRFSLHALYRNRLIRAYLGASRQARHPDRFTGFDIKDNIRMWDLWPQKSGGGFNSNSLFHVVNIALNVVATKRKAWQQRKAEPFTVSPLHCGSSYLGFRESGEYGDSIHTQSGQGITLGTAMAISGAAVSPNMGYHSSPSVELLLTFFNVRLGWWLGNPGDRGNKTYKKEGPGFAVWPLLAEAFGQTTDQRGYVYLSDGGHFENLGLYEMVRRRCRFIIVVDAGCDPKFGFEDLGNAVQKIYIDLGVAIEFEGLWRLQNRPATNVIQRETTEDLIPYCATGTIFYKEADGIERGCENGRIIYIKPAYHDANEGAGIRSYATANPTFPHESTADQWFTESQFESYRSLGLEITQKVLNNDVNAQPLVNGFLAERRGLQSGTPN